MTTWLTVQELETLQAENPEALPMMDIRLLTNEIVLSGGHHPCVLGTEQIDVGRILVRGDEGRQ